MPSIYEVTDVKLSRLFRLNIAQNIQRDGSFDENDRD